MGTHQAEITSVESELYEWDKPPIWNGKHVYDKGALHLVRVRARKGAEKIVGYGFNGGTAATRPQDLFPKYVDLFRPQVLGRDPTDTTYVSGLAENVKIYGPGGYHTQVLAAINQACWDIRGKIEGKSIHQLLDGTQQRIRTYIAGGYYGRDKGLNELKEEMDRNVKEFHATAVKMKIGDKEAGLEHDIERIEAVRAQVGHDVTVMVDANCALSVEEVKAYLPALKANDIYWLEEPVDSRDHRGHSKVREMAQDYNILIATGENGYDIYHFRKLIDDLGADVFNIDVAILPGYEPALAVTEESLEHGIHIAPHGAQELQVHIAAARNNGLMLEYYPPAVDPLRGEMFLPQMVLEHDGYVTVPDRPGIGFEPNMDLLGRHRIQ